jgi:ribosomal protein L11 methyltransferase
MTLFQVVFPSSKEQALDLLEAFDEALSVSGYEDVESGDWFGELHFETEDEAQTAVVQAQALFGVDAKVAPLPDIDWVKKSLEDLPAVEAGRFLIHGSHLSPQPRPGQIPLLIDAGQAFGTGHHGTTRGCLIALSDLVKSVRSQNVLDLGCGTGVLAVGFAKLSPARILASDIDPIAVKVAKEVARENGVHPRLQFAIGPGFRAPQVRAAGLFDLIIANILARPLVALAPEMAQNTRPGGQVVLSGLLIEQERRVLNAYLAQGFSFQRHIHLDDWSTLVLSK